MSLPAVRRFVMSSGLLILALTPGVGLAGAALSPLWRALASGPPVVRPDRLVVISEVSAERGWTDAPGSPANLRDWEHRSTVLSAVAFHASGRTRGQDAGDMVLTGAGDDRLLRVLRTSANLMATLGVAPSKGRDFTPDDTLTSSAPVALISDGLARRLSREAGDAVGRTIRLDDREHTVVGQMPVGFYFPTTDVEIWTPIQINAADFTSRRQSRIFRGIARLSEGTTLAQARQDLLQVAASLSTEYPRTNGNTSVRLDPLRDWLTGPRRVANTLAATAGGLILLIALINAGLVAWMADVSRQNDREIKRALGASRSHLCWEAARNTVLVGAVAMLAAIPLAAGAVAAANASMGTESGEPIQLDWRAVALAGVVSLVGLSLVRLRWVVAPAKGRMVPAKVRWISAAQAMVSVILVVAAAAVFRGFVALAAVPSGLPDAPDAATISVTLRGPRFRDQTVVAQYVRTALAQVRALPGVTAAGATAMLPLTGAGWTSSVWLPERGLVNAEVRHREVTDGYVRASGLRLIEGREFTTVDGPASPAVMVNEALVRTLNAGRSPLGLDLMYSDPSGVVDSGAPPPRRWRVVGVVGNERLDARHPEDVPMIYQPHAVNPEETMTFVVRAGRTPQSVISDAIQMLRNLDSAAVVLRAEPLTMAIARPLARERAMAQLAAAVAVVAVMLAALGLYGLTSLDTRQRRRELAVRIALGASINQVRAFLFRRAITPTAAGLGTGLIASGLLARSAPAASSVVSVAGTDFVWAALIMATAATLACIPALVRTGRHTAVDLR